jgi:hypothetical protein
MNMKKISAVSLLLFTIGCAPTPPVANEGGQNDVVQGTRIDPADVTGKPNMVLKFDKDEVDGTLGDLTVGELLKRMDTGAWGFPNVDSFSDCDDVVSAIGNSAGVELVTVAENTIVAKSSEATMIYNFPNGGCNTE